MQIIGGIVENLMGDKYKSRYKDKENTEYFMNVKSDVKFSVVKMQTGNIESGDVNLMIFLELLLSFIVNKKHLLKHLRKGQIQDFTNNTKMKDLRQQKVSEACGYKFL